MKESKVLAAALALVVGAGMAVESFATQQDQDRSACVELSKDPGVTHFKGLKMVENTLHAEFCASASVMKWKWKGFTPPITFFLSDEAIQERLTDESLSQAQIKQYGIARAELREALQPK